MIQTNSGRHDWTVPQKGRTRDDGCVACYEGRTEQNEDVECLQMWTKVMIGEEMEDGAAARNRRLLWRQD